MNARLAARLARSNIASPERNPTPALRAVPATISRAPLVLTNGPEFGKPDRLLARMVCQNLAETTPPIQVAPNPLTNARIRRLLRMHHPI